MDGKESTPEIQLMLGLFMSNVARDPSRSFSGDGRELINGPLSDMSVLVQIPLVRKIAVELTAIIDYSDPFIDELRNALDATS